MTGLDSKRRRSITEVINEGMLKNLIPHFSKEHHKGTGGTALLFCGSVGYAGAAALSAAGCLRCGVGIVRCVVPEKIYPIVSSAVPEAVFSVGGGRDRITKKDVQRVIKNNYRVSSVLIGCGIGTKSGTERAVEDVLREFNVPTVIDADGLNLLSSRIYCIKRHPDTIITPHPGEAARLLGTTAEDIQSDRFSAVVKLSEITGGIAVLKGHNTLIADTNGNVFVCPFGNPGMGKGGSGDVLSGMITAFLAQGMKPLDSAILGVSLHSLAGDAAAERLGEISMMPTDIIKALPDVIKNLY